MPSFDLIRMVAEIDTGHRLIEHKSQCGNPHGHRYKIEICVSGHSLDSVGLVVDFSLLKSRLGGWLKEYWDHTMVLETTDPLVQAMYGNNVGYATEPETEEDDSDDSDADFKELVRYGAEESAVGPKDMRKPCFLLPYAPSAENMAMFLYEVICPRLFKKELKNGTFRVKWIRIYETPNCAVTYPAEGGVYNPLVTPEDARYLIARLKERSVNKEG